MDIKIPTSTQLDAMIQRLDSIEANLVAGNYDLRGRAADKPPANSVPIGATYWSVDTDPHMYALEASDGEKWFKIVPEEDEKTIEIPTDYFFRFDASQMSLSDGDPVDVWQDLSGNGNDLSQTEESRKPVFLEAGLNGKPTVQFAGTYLDRAAFMLPNTSQVTLFAVTQIDDGSKSSCALAIAEDNLLTQAYALRTSGSSKVFGVYINTWSGVASAGLSFDLDGTLYSSVYNGTSVNMYQDGVFSNGKELEINPIGAHNVLRVGASARVGHTQEEPYYGRISEIILFPRALSNQEMSKMHAHLKEKWGI